jgi:hypothetical protein
MYELNNNGVVEVEPARYNQDKTEPRESLEDLEEKVMHRGVIGDN